jgi:hypothetical protein
MEFLTPTAAFALPASVLLLLTLVLMRWRQRQQGQRQQREALDTVADWPPEAARVLSITERQAHELLKRAMPGFLVLAQVPLSRFVRVPMRHSYGDWLQRVGSLSADLLLCDAGSRVLAVIDIRATQETERSRRRHERMARVLRAAGIQVHTWREGDLPALAEVRMAMSHLVGAAAPANRFSTSGPMPLIPVAECAEVTDLDAVLAAGDHAAQQASDTAMEPVPSAFLDDFEPAAQRR